MRPAALALAALVPAALGGCVGAEVDVDGRAMIYFVNLGPPAFVLLYDESGNVTWTGRLVEQQGELVEVPVRPGGCHDYKVFAGWDGNEPDTLIRYAAPCDRDQAPMRVEVRPPRT